MSLNKNVKTLRVLLIGCGNISGGFDHGRSAKEYPYTHAGAYRRDQRFEVVACVEPDETRRAVFMKVWGIPVGFTSMDDLLGAGEEFDIISICSPTASHVQDLEMALSLNPKLVFCEKPITSSIDDTENIVEAYAKKNVLLAVNYSRRWDPDVFILPSIMGEKWGDLRAVSGVYNKGILNNGSHMLDMLNLILGSMNIVSVGEPLYDFFPDDPAIPVCLESSEGVSVQLSCGNAKDYAIFELEFIFSLGVLSMEDGGLFWRERRAIESNDFKGYRMLDEGFRRVGEYPKAMLQSVDNIYRAVKEGEVLHSTGESALSVQRLCEEIKRKACELMEDNL